MTLYGLIAPMASGLLLAQRRRPAQIMTLLITSRASFIQSVSGIGFTLETIAHLLFARQTALLVTVVSVLQTMNLLS